jgi:hypothetical protein
VEVGKDGKIAFEGENVDIVVDNPLTDYFKKIPFSGDSESILNNIPFMRDSLFEGIQHFSPPPGVVLQGIQLEQMHVKGNFAQSFVQQGDLTLQGDFSIETKGKIHMSYHGFHFQTLVTITLPHIYRLATKNKTLDEIIFEGAEISFDGLFASLAVKNIFKS